MDQTLKIRPWMYVTINCLNGIYIDSVTINAVWPCFWTTSFLSGWISSCDTVCFSWITIQLYCSEHKFQICEMHIYTIYCFTVLSRHSCADSVGVISSAFCLLTLWWKSWVIRLTACLHCVTHEATGGSRYVSVCKRLLQLLLGPLRSLTSPERLRLTAQSRYRWSPTLLLLFSFPFQSPFALLHLLRLPLFYALSSHNTVGGAELEYLEVLWASLSGIHF